MIDKGCFASGLGVLLFLLGACAPRTGDPLSGSVADQDDAPLHGAIVRAEDALTGIATVALTGPDGEFRFPRLSPGKYRLSSKKKGYEPAEARTIEIDGAASRVGLTQNALATIPISQLSSADIIRHLPAAPEKMVMVDSCVQCHSLGTVLARGLDRDGWGAVLERMKLIPGGYVRINDSNTPPIIDYLAEHFGPDSPRPANFGDQVQQVAAEIPFGHEVIITEYPIPTPVALPHTAVPDQRGNVWFAEFGGRKVGRLEVATGRITEFPTNEPTAHPHGITAAPDGTVWFTVLPYGIGRIQPGADELELIKIPDHEDGQPAGAHTIIVARDGIIWFSEILGGSIGRYDPASGDYQSFAVEKNSAPYGIVEREDNVFWFATLRSGKIGRLDGNNGEIKLYPIPSKDPEAQRLRFDAKGRIWFGEYETGKIGMFELASEQFTEYDLPFRGSAYSIHVDQTGDVWIGALERDSLIRFDPDTEEMREYQLPGVGAIVRDIWPDEEGRMWFVQWGRNMVTSVEILN